MGEVEERESKEREPICGFCWAKLNVRQPLEFRPLGGYWECPVCLTKAENPADEEAVKELAESDPRRFEKTVASTLRWKKSRSKPSGRKRKKPKKKRQWASEEISV